ncbi:MAG: uracil-DNA glycosylase [Candidatus Aenigmatarchaeota archaeon]
MGALNEKIINCKRCRLYRFRRNAVPGEGSGRKKVFFVGEAPGREEDLEGRPFAGKAGRFLSAMLATIDMKRDDAFLTNVVKCRPPGNRQPKKDEIEACMPYLQEQIAGMKPKIIVPMGKTAVKALLGKGFSVAKDHGRKIKKGRLTYILMPHPAAASRFPSMRKIMQQDFVVLKKAICRT